MNDFVKRFSSKELLLIAGLTTLSVFIISFTTQRPLKAFKITGVAQGTTYQVIYYAKNSIITTSAIDSIFNSIDSSMSLYKPYSLINTFNASARGIIADENMLTVVRKAIEIYKATDGTFDITIKPVVDAWGFGIVQTVSSPDSSTLPGLMQCVGSNYLQLKGDSLIKKKPCIQIDLNGIAQGYSVDVICRYLDKKGVQNYLVELGGEIKVKGRKQPEKQEFTVGIEGPPTNAFFENEVKKTVKLKKGAITTSGNYKRYIETDGRRRSHLIDARTGYPVSNELISVTVWSNDAITSDGYDNALMAMGLKKALEFVQLQKSLQAYFIYKTPNGTITDTATTGFYRLLHQE